MEHRGRGAALLVALALVVGGAALFFVALGADRDPEETLARFFHALGGRNVRTCSRLLTPERRRMQNLCGDADIRWVRLLQVERVAGAAARELAYLRTRPRLYAARLLRAEFEIAFYEDRAMESGRHAYTFILVREGPTTPWRIADWTSGP